MKGGGGAIFPQPDSASTTFHPRPSVSHTPHPPELHGPHNCGSLRRPFRCGTCPHLHWSTDLQRCPCHGGKWNRGSCCFSGSSLLLTPPQEARKGLTLSSWARRSNQPGDPRQLCLLPPSSAELWNTFSSPTALLVSRLPLNILLLYFIWISIIFCRSAVLFLCNLSYPKCNFHPLPFFKKYIIGV